MMTPNENRKMRRARKAVTRLKGTAPVLYLVDPEHHTSKRSTHGGGGAGPLLKP